MAPLLELLDYARRMTFARKTSVLDKDYDMAQAESLLKADAMDMALPVYVQGRSHWRDLAWRLAIFFGRLVSVSLVLFGLFRLSIDLRNAVMKTDDTRSCACGNTVDEAIANGCKFDPIATAWLPDFCRDDELTAEFNRAGPGPDGQWTYYSDWDKTNTLTLDEVARLPDTKGFFFATHEWHVKHCSFEWQKQWRKKQFGTTVAKRFNSLGHIRHCEQMFLLRIPLQDVVTGSGVSLNADHVPVPHHHDQGVSK